MAGSSFIFSVETPHKHFRRTSEQKEKDIGKDVLEIFGTELADAIWDDVVTWGKKAGENQLRVLAIFFQRLVSRTPMDEDYTKYIVSTDDETGEERVSIIEHHADANFARLDWTLSIADKVRITSYELVAAYPDMFKVFNNKNDINNIYQYLRSKLKTNKGVNLDDIYNVEITNMNDHFLELEYGTKRRGKLTSQGPLYPHGIVNGHSVQAPNGMLRLSLLELDQIFKTENKNPGASTHIISHRYADQKTKKNPTDKRISQMLTTTMGKTVTKIDAISLMKKLTVESLLE